MRFLTVPALLCLALVGNLPARASPLSDSNFYVRTLGSRCFSLGNPQAWIAQNHIPVVLRNCAPLLSQRIRVEEIDATTNDILLHPPGSPLCIGVAVPAGEKPAPGQELELQVCDTSGAQRFAFDGDALLVGIQGQGLRNSRDYVVKPAGSSTEVGTHLVVDVRKLDDAEFIRMDATNGSRRRPTSGFIRVANETALDAALAGAGWGTVIEVTASMDLKYPGKLLPAGSTLRGDRKFTDNGPNLRFQSTLENAEIFALEDGTRITGLRLTGPTRSDDKSIKKISAISVSSAFQALDNVIVDHVEASQWTSAAINTKGSAGGNDPHTCYDGIYPRPAPLKIVGNFIHHNVGGFGYGVATGQGANPYLRGNVMYRNKHSITSDGNGSSGYVAHDNLVTSGAIPGHPFNSMQSMDVHGTDNPGHWDSGTAGDIFDIGWNTYLLDAHRNFVQRGTPCHYSSFHDNIAKLPSSRSVQTGSIPPTTLVLAKNHFRATNPVQHLAVGDFDGDGVDDVFVGTGNTWWFSSGGQAEWRFLNRMPETAIELLFADFDGDGRTDIAAVHGSRLDVSWAAISPWSRLATAPAPLADLAIGDFDGDGRSDVFVSDGTEWYYLSAGKTRNHLSHLGFRVTDLRFGDFTGDGRTDVFFQNDNAWVITPGVDEYRELQIALTPDVAGLVVADFDGDGIADVARRHAGNWEYSSAGTSGFTALRSAQGDIALLPIGRFDGDATADVVLWSGLRFAIAPAARNPTRILSRQDMK